jgi:hypothetical protein
MLIKKHLLLLSITVAISLLIVATFYYPGGSQQDANAVGYSWQHNYLCNLFNEKAMNGIKNGARPLAITGLFCLCASFALFFYRFSFKIQDKTASKVIKYAGVSAMFFSFLVVTPFHDLMTTVSSVLGLVALFYILVFIMKSKLTLFKLLTLVTMLLLYFNNYIYYTQHWLHILPILQKITIFIVLIMMLCLDYFTEGAPFSAYSSDET